MTTLLLLLATIGQCQGGRCPAPVTMQAKDMTAVREARAVIVAAGYAASDLLPDDPRHLASYDLNTRSIRLNVWDAYWDDRGRRAELNFRLGYNSSSHPDHILRHEMGHAELHKVVGTARMVAIGKEPLPLPAGRVRAEVSTYAALNPVEFQAEVFAGLKAGRTFPADVLDAYAKLMRP